MTKQPRVANSGVPATRRDTKVEAGVAHSAENPHAYPLTNSPACDYVLRAAIAEAYRRDLVVPADSPLLRLKTANWSWVRRFEFEVAHIEAIAGLQIVVLGDQPLHGLQVYLQPTEMGRASCGYQEFFDELGPDYCAANAALGYVDLTPDIDLLPLEGKGLWGHPALLKHLAAAATGQ